MILASAGNEGHQAVLLDSFASLQASLPPGFTCRLSEPSRAQYQGISRETRRDAELSQADRDNAIYHSSIRTWLGDSIDAVRKAWISQEAEEWFLQPVEGLRFEGKGSCGNTTALDLAAWVSACPTAGVKSDMVEVQESMPISKAIGGICTNRSNRHVTMTLQGEEQHANLPATFLLPPRSCFLLSDMSSWHDRLSSTCTSLAASDQTVVLIPFVSTSNLWTIRSSPLRSAMAYVP